MKAHRIACGRASSRCGAWLPASETSTKRPPPCAAAGHRGDILELKELDDVTDALDNALVPVRTIDLEVLEPSDKPAHQAARSGSPRVESCGD